MSISQDRLYAVVTAGLAVEARYYDLCNQIREIARAVSAGNLDLNSFWLKLEAATNDPKRDLAVESKVFEVEHWRYKFTHKRNEANAARMRYSRAGIPYDKREGQAYPGLRSRPRPGLQIMPTEGAPSAEDLGFGAASPPSPSWPIPPESNPRMARTPTYVPSGTEYDEDTQREIDIARGLRPPGPTNDDMIMAELGIPAGQGEDAAPPVVKKPTGLA